MQGIEELSARVREHGGKVTGTRLLIWRALAQDRTHPTAEELYARLRPENPNLSLTTVYNVLRELTEWGELRRFDTGDGHIHYDPDTRPHAELICMRCHSISDAPDEELEAAGVTRPARGPDGVPALPARIAGFQVVTRSEQYYGFCPTCVAASIAPARGA